MSVKKTLFLALQKHLKATLKKLLWADKNMGQLNALDQFEVFPMPAILIEFGRIEWTSLGNNIKQGLCRVKLIVVFENYSAANSETNDAERNIATEHFDFCELVKKKVEGFQGTGWSKFNFVADEEDNDHQNFIVTPMEFETLLTDDSTAKDGDEVDVDPDVTVKYKRPLERPESNLLSDFVITPKG